MKVPCAFCGKLMTKTDETEFCASCIPERLKASGAKEYKNPEIIDVGWGYCLIREKSEVPDA